MKVSKVFHSCATSYFYIEKKEMHTRKWFGNHMDIFAGNAKMKIYNSDIRSLRCRRHKNIIHYEDDTKEKNNHDR